MKTTIKNRLFTLASALALFCAPALEAQLNFHIDINTAALIGAPNAPFFLDFQLNAGSGSLLNSVTLSGFTFDNGSATGTAALFGNAFGSLTSTVSLNDSPASPFNEFFQGFSAGTTAIHFNGTITRNTPGATPDGFFVAILDSEAGNPQIFTNSPDTLSLIALNITSANSPVSVSVYSSTSPAGVTAAFIPVPESSTYALAAGALLTGLVLVRRRKSVFSR